MNLENYRPYQRIDSTRSFAQMSGKYMDQNTSKQNQNCASVYIPQRKNPFLPLLLSHNTFVNLPRSEDVATRMRTSVAGAVNHKDVFNKQNTCEQVINGNFCIDKVLALGRQNTNRLQRWFPRRWENRRSETRALKTEVEQANL